ncbi:MAG TPA: 4-(cytidine 5'-diphospho)-2-C-methyl-D-erythritol kinase [Thermoanaerobaculia bacterium]|nr:4-(cytidine 5'-diphospho)-2-C-methyl-D-erythritol kinase [Thermoanaerobaculia bacterium]
MIQVRSHAKINWALRILGRRPDGYHDLETLFQTISLHDTITIRESSEWNLSCDDPSVPTDETNLILKAARALGTPAVAIEVRKRIPAGGGLGGGSSNAAATLVALARMFAVDDRALHEIALSIGSDVPFFLVGGTAYATGRGEELARMPAASPIPLLLIFPEERVSTPEAFRLIRGYSQPVGMDVFDDAVRGDLLSHRDLLVNDFEGPIFEQLPKLRAFKERLYEAGAAWAGMSGSGSTMVGAFRSQAARDQAAAAFSDVRWQRAETTA